MKKLISIIILLVVLGFGGYFIYVNYIMDEGIIPEEEIGTQLTIRTELPKNNQRIGIRLAEDYCFEKQLGELTQLAE